VEDDMERKEPGEKAETPAGLEASILSAHMEYFKGKSKAYCSLKKDDFAIYDTVIRYFKDRSV
jgi:hypothetical protein